MKVHLRLNQMKQSTIGLPKFSNSLAQRMQCAHTQSRGLCLGFNVGKKVGEKNGQMIWDLWG